MKMRSVKRITKDTDKQFDIQNPEEGSWWRYLEPSELKNTSQEYGLTNILETQRCPKMKGKKCQKMAPSKEFARQWEAKDPGGKYLRVSMDHQRQSEYDVDEESRYGFLLGEAFVRVGKLED